MGKSILFRTIPDTRFPLRFFLIEKATKKNLAPSVLQTSEFSGTSFAPKNFAPFFSLILLLRFPQGSREKNQKRLPTVRP